MIDRFSVTMQIDLRTCEEHDLLPLEWDGAFTSHRAIIQAQYERHLRGKNVMLVADQGGYPIGQVWIDLERYAAERVALLWALRVIAPLQSLGIGRRLIAAAEEVAAAAGFDVIELAVDKDNLRAYRLYERVGYAPIRDEVSAETYVAPDGSSTQEIHDQWILRKPLEGSRLEPSRAARAR